MEKIFVVTDEVIDSVNDFLKEKRAHVKSVNKINDRTAFIVVEYVDVSYESNSGQGGWTIQ